MIKQYFHGKQLTKDEAFRGFINIMYVSHVLSDLAHIFSKFPQSPSAKKKSSFSLGDCPALLTIGVSIIDTSKPDPDSSYSLFHGNWMSSSSETSEDSAAEIILNQFLPSSLQLGVQDTSNEAKATFHSVREGRSPRHQLHALPNTDESTEVDVSMSEVSSTIV